MKKNIAKIEDLFFSPQFLKEFGINAEFDGIANINTYVNSPKKILWILKEGNWGDDGSDEMQSAEKIKEEKLSKEVIAKNKRMKEYYEDITAYSDWKRTFSKILYTNYGIIEGVDNYNKMPNLDVDAKINGKNYLENCVFLNLKKIPGHSTSNMSVIRRFYNQHKPYILKQIKAVDADIIINASGVYELAKDLFPEGNYNDKQYFTKDNNKLVIDVYHPNARVGSEEYINNILKILKKNIS